MNRYILRTICLAILISVIVDKSAYAYLDWGMGSYFFQMLIASLLGVLFSIKMFWRKLIVFVKGSIFKQK